VILAFSVSQPKTAYLFYGGSEAAPTMLRYKEGYDPLLTNGVISVLNLCLDFSGYQANRSPTPCRSQHTAHTPHGTNRWSLADPFGSGGEAPTPPGTARFRRSAAAGGESPWRGQAARASDARTAARFCPCPRANLASHARRWWPGKLGGTTGRADGTCAGAPALLPLLLLAVAAVSRARCLFLFLPLGW
jgi:hypothetical protein